jgi:hypothetical protein
MPGRSRWQRRQMIVMGGAESNHGAIVRSPTHSTSHSSSHRRARGPRSGRVCALRQLTATLTATLTGLLTATLTGPGHSPVNRGARSNRRGS